MLVRDNDCRILLETSGGQRHPSFPFFQPQKTQKGIFLVEDQLNCDAAGAEKLKFVRVNDLHPRLDRRWSILIARRKPAVAGVAPRWALRGENLL